MEPPQARKRKHHHTEMNALMHQQHGVLPELQGGGQGHMGVITTRHAARQQAAHISAEPRSWKDDTDQSKEYKTGKFTDQEDKILVDAMRTYCSDHEVEMSSLVGTRATTARGAWQHIGSHLPDRTIMSLYNHAIRCHPELFGLKNGPWSNEETEQLRVLVATHGTQNWVLVGEHLNRVPNRCREKYNHIIHPYNKGPWSDAEIAKLQAIMREVQASQDQYGNKRFPWEEISRKMETRSPKQCCHCWNNKQGVDPDRPVVPWTNARCLEMVRNILETTAQDISEVVWQDVAPEHMPVNVASKKFKVKFNREAANPLHQGQFLEILKGMENNLGDYNDNVELPPPTPAHQAPFDMLYGPSG